MDKFHPDLIAADGGYTWNIVAAGAYSASDIVTALQQGRLYFNVHTVNYPNGEIRGFLDGHQRVADRRPSLWPIPATRTTAPPTRAPRASSTRHRFGAAPADVAYVKANGYAAWINAQLAVPATGQSGPDVQQQIALTASANLNASPVDNAWWREAVTGSGPTPAARGVSP